MPGLVVQPRSELTALARRGAPLAPAAVSQKPSGQSRRARAESFRADGAAVGGRAAPQRLKRVPCSALPPAPSVRGRTPLIPTGGRFSHEAARLLPPAPFSPAHLRGHRDPRSLTGPQHRLGTGGGDRGQVAGRRRARELPAPPASAPHREQGAVRVREPPLLRGAWPPLRESDRRRAQSERKKRVTCSTRHFRKCPEGAALLPAGTRCFAVVRRRGPA